jgi:Rrf2 family protein
MRLTKKTEYALVCLVYMARQIPFSVITVRNLVSNEHYSVTFTEKILQKLRRASVVVAHHGKEGGYSLDRHPSEIRLREIIEALEGETFEVFCEPRIREKIICTHLEMCGVRPVWRKTKELLDGFFDSVTLEMMAKGEYESGGLIAKAQ